MELLAIAAFAIAQSTSQACPAGTVQMTMVVPTKGGGSTIVRRCVRPGAGTSPSNGGLVVGTPGGSCGLQGACASEKIENLLEGYGQKPADFGLRAPTERTSDRPTGADPR